MILVTSKIKRQTDRDRRPLRERQPANDRVFVTFSFQSPDIAGSNEGAAADRGGEFVCEQVQQVLQQVHTDMCRTAGREQGLV